MRQGPRPLPLHLVSATATWSGSPAALTLLKSGWRPSSSALRARAEALLHQAGDASPESLTRALGDAVARRGAAFLDAIERYRNHPYSRDLIPWDEFAPRVLWREGTTRLLEFQPGGRTSLAPVFLVPSLINRATILDLMPGRSLARWLAARGHPVILVDWDAPGEAERGFDLTAYIAERLVAAFDVAAAHWGRRPVAIGYCMGGLLALALAQLRTERLCGLVLLATPWDFHAESELQARMLAATGRGLLPVIEATGELPTDAIQSLFAALDPVLAVRKFLAFGALDPRSPAAEAFVALEDWLNDGVPLAGPTARECLLEWYGENTPGRACWRIAGVPMRPSRLKLPSLCLVPSRDRIVPPASAAALGAALPDCRVETPPVGHIGMIVSRHAESRVWQPLAAWLAERDSAPGRKGRAKSTTTPRKKATARQETKSSKKTKGARGAKGPRKTGRDNSRA